VIIQSVELVALPNAPAYQSKIYRAHLDTGEDIDLFQQKKHPPKGGGGKRRPRTGGNPNKPQQ